MSLGSALITTSAVSLSATVREQGGDADPLRVIQGLAPAIGFIAAGMIFVARRSVKNLTTAASIWFSAPAGIVAGAAQYRLLAVAMGMSLTVLVLLGLLGRFGLSRSDGGSP
ncbi:MgtC/SapB family protein [Methylobacterium sp. ID0610]|uniref:MgtC/SapB family protein n=1 Tax=Methylobacterium carpenticola TaxID=3344827 RepID=UPI0036A5A129